MGRYTPGPNDPTVTDLQYESFAQANDGSPGVVVINSDGSSVGSSFVSSANTPAIQTAATALASNTSRKGWQIQNVGTNPLFVLLGSGASTSVFHAVLKGGTSSSDGTGGSISQLDGVIYTGIITVAGTSPSYVVTAL